MNSNYENIKKYIELLELPQDEQLNLEKIKQQYRLLFKKYHPDYTQCEEYKDGKKLKKITEAYQYLQDNIDYVNNLLIADIKALEQKKKEIENQRLINLQIKQEKEQKNNEQYLIKQQEYEIKAKEEIKNQINIIKESINKEQYVNKDYKHITKLLNDFYSKIDSYKNIDKLEEKFLNVKDEINNINKLSNEEITKRKTRIILISIIPLLLIVSLFIINIIGVNTAEKHLINGEYEKAQSLLNITIGNKSKQLKERIDIYKALNNDNYDEAIYLFSEQGDCIINYSLNGGELDENNLIQLEYGSYCKSNKLGYNFIGYEVSQYKITEYKLEIELNALYECITYQIDYILNEGSINDDVPKTYNIETDGITIATPEKYGYVFKGWIVNNSEQLLQQYIIQKGTTNDLTLEAVWEPKLCKITFDVDGGIPLDNTVMYVEYKTEVAMPIPEKEGHIFDGWQSGGVIYRGVMEWDIIRDLTLVARWNIATYQIKYHYQGDKHEEIQIQNIEYGSDYKLIIPEREGYTFVGWHKDSLKFNDGTWWYTTDIELYGEWKVNTYNIKYDLYGGKFTTDPITKIEYGTEIILPTPTRTNFTFMGWYYDDVEVENGIWKIGEDVILKAKWLQGTNVIRYKLDGGTNDPLNPDKYNKKHETTIFNPTKIGYSFVGWIVNDSETPINSYIVPPNTEGSIVLKAVWEKTPYKIIYQISDTETETQIVYYGDYYHLKEISKPGYRFNSWMGPSYETILSGVWDRETDLIVTPVWSPIQYKISFELYGGMQDYPNTVYIKYNYYYTLPSPTKEGYEFLGWYYNNEKIPLEGKWSLIPDAYDIILSAEWKQK